MCTFESVHLRIRTPSNRGILALIRNSTSIELSNCDEQDGTQENQTVLWQNDNQPDVTERPASNACIPGAGLSMGRVDLPEMSSWRGGCLLENAVQATRRADGDRTPQGALGHHHQ
jgi:hypothetical protein